MTNVRLCSSILALNSGSSSLKFGLYRIEACIAKVLLSGEAESIGGRDHNFWAKAEAATSVSESANFETHRHAVARVGKFLADRNAVQPAAIGHRVVHGGSTLRQHCFIDEGVQRQLESAAAFAPLHNPPALTVIRFVQEYFRKYRRLPVSIRRFTLRCRRSRAPCRSQRNYVRTASGVMDFMAFPAS